MQILHTKNRDSVSKYSNWELLLRPVVELSSRGFFNSNIVFLSSVSIDINYISLESPISFGCFDLHFYFRYLFSYFSFPCSYCVSFFFPSGMSRALCTRKTNWRAAGPRKSVATLQRLRLVVAGGGASQPIALSSYGISSWIQRCITPRKTKETKNAIEPKL